MFIYKLLYAIVSGTWRYGDDNDGQWVCVDDDDDDDVILCFLNDDLFAYIHITGMSLSHRMKMINNFNSTSIQSPVTDNITGIGSVAIQWLNSPRITTHKSLSNWSF